MAPCSGCASSSRAPRSPRGRPDRHQLLKATWSSHTLVPPSPVCLHRHATILMGHMHHICRPAVGLIDRYQGPSIAFQILRCVSKPLKMIPLCLSVSDGPANLSEFPGNINNHDGDCFIEPHPRKVRMGDISGDMVSKRHYLTLTKPCFHSSRAGPFDTSIGSCGSRQQCFHSQQKWLRTMCTYLATSGTKQCFHPRRGGAVRTGLPPQPGRPAGPGPPVGPQPCAGALLPAPPHLLGRGRHPAAPGGPPGPHR